VARALLSSRWQYVFAAVFFNDAGIGKDEAGVVALRLLQDRGLAAGTVLDLTLLHGRLWT